MCKPLTDLTRRDSRFYWSPQCQTNFEKLITILTTPPVLAYPRFSEQFYLATDASTQAIGGVLTQYCDILQAHKPIGYCGRALNKHEQNYSITKLELLAVIYCVLHFQVYLRNPSKPFILYTVHSALSSILHKKPLSAQMARYSLILQGFQLKVVHVKGLLNSAEDCLSRRTYLLSSDNITAEIQKFPDNQILGRPSPDPSIHLRLSTDEDGETSSHDAQLTSVVTPYAKRTVTFAHPVAKVIPNRDEHTSTSSSNTNSLDSDSHSSDSDSPHDSTVMRWTLILNYQQSSPTFHLTMMYTS